MNEDQFFNDLQTSLSQAIDHAKGKPSKARTKTVEIKELAFFTAEDIKSLRLQMNLTQNLLPRLWVYRSKPSNPGSVEQTSQVVLRDDCWKF